MHHVITVRCSWLPFLFMLAALAGCANPGNVPGSDHLTTTFGSPSVGGYLLFAEHGKYEVWRTSQDIELTESTPAAAGDLGSDVRLVGLSVGHRHTSVLSQRHDDATLGLHYLGSNGLSASRVVLTRQPPLGWKAASYSTYLRNPKNCLEGETDSVLLMEPPSNSGLLDEVWIVSESGLVRQQLTFARPVGFLPVAAGMGAVESPAIWILFAAPSGLQAKLVQTRSSQNANELLLTGIEVPYIDLGTPSTNRPAASGFSFAATVSADYRGGGGSYIFWWHVYKWRLQDPDRTAFVIVDEPGQGGSNNPGRLMQGQTSPPLDLVAYADRRPACVNVKSLPFPDKLRTQQRYWEAFDGALKLEIPGR